jgi:small basic protein
MTTAVLVGPFDHKVWLSTWFWPIFTAAHKVFLQKTQKLNLQLWLTLITSFCSSVNKNNPIMWVIQSCELTNVRCWSRENQK